VHKRILVQFVCFALFPGLLLGCANQNISIADIYDGDTVTTSTGTKIRLLQIDTPELSSGECHAEESKSLLESYLDASRLSKSQAELGLKNLVKSSGVKLESDTGFDQTDKYGRNLSYLIVDDLNLNIELVRIGAATPYFYEGKKGKYSTELEQAAEYAKQNRLGVWGMCPGFVYNPNEPINAGVSTSSYVESKSDNDSGVVGVIVGNGECSADYRECVPPYPPDLNCGDLVSLGLIHVTGSDPHRLDRDGDGLACESNAN